MLVGFTFPAGRYHATPWASHVNEGAVEWPPSPWRLVRTLVATGYAKLGWREVPPVGRALVEALASHLPRYWLSAELTTGHTRHYMPDGALAKLDPKKGVWNRSTDLVIDAFVTLPRDRLGLVVEWDVELAASELDLMDQLVSRTSHLGRAETWVTATIPEEVPGELVACEPGEFPPDARWERVSLLAPLPRAVYHNWRETWEPQRAPGRGAKKTGKGAAKKNVITLPTDIVDALQATTGELQKAGWSQPPGSRWVSYWRHPDAVVERPAKRSMHRRPRASLPTTALFALASDTLNSEVLPRLSETLWQGEAVHDALVSVSSRGQVGAAPACLTGKDPSGMPLQGHRHAHVLPLTLDRKDNRIDHLLVHAPMGLDECAQLGMQRLRHTYAKDLPTLYVTLVGLGRASDMSRRVRELATARVWESRTPFVPPRHLKDRGKDTIVGQALAECMSRGLPAPVRVEVEVTSSLERSGGEPGGRAWLAAECFGELRARVEGRRYRGKVGAEPLEDGLRFCPRWRHFRRARRDEAKAPPQAIAVGLRLVFAEPVQGPIALGYGSHFGLGLMRPARDDVAR